MVTPPSRSTIPISLAYWGDELMRNIAPSLLLLCATVVTCFGRDYHGFKIDESDVGLVHDIEPIRGAIEQQVDIVRCVGFSPDVLTFLQSVPFEVIPAGTTRSATPGLYNRLDRTVKVTVNIVRVGHKPVLLHELLHAYHDQRVKGGYGNRDINRFYEEARKLGVHPPSSHMMENSREYFACCATTYLFGVTAQEPFRRERIKTAQPEFYAFLETMFGPGAGKYVGSLTN